MISIPMGPMGIPETIFGWWTQTGMFHDGVVCFESSWTIPVSHNDDVSNMFFNGMLLKQHQKIYDFRPWNILLDPFRPSKSQKLRLFVWHQVMVHSRKDPDSPLSPVKFQQISGK